MTKITWNPLQYPQPGDIVGWNHDNLVMREVVSVRSNSIRYRKRFSGGTCAPDTVTTRFFECQRKSWVSWCTKNKPMVLKGGSRMELTNPQALIAEAKILFDKLVNSREFLLYVGEGMFARRIQRWLDTVNGATVSQETTLNVD